MITVAVDSGNRVVVNEDGLDLLAFFHPNAAGAARELVRLIEGAELA